MKKFAQLLFLTVPGSIIFASLLISAAILIDAGIIRVKIKSSVSPKTAILGQKAKPSATPSPSQNLRRN